MTLLKKRLLLFPRKSFYFTFLLWIGLILFSKFNYVRMFPNGTGQVWMLTTYNSLELSCYGLPIIFCIALVSLENDLPLTSMIYSRLTNGRNQLFSLEFFSILTISALLSISHLAGLLLVSVGSLKSKNWRWTNKNVHEFQNWMHVHPITQSSVIFQVLFSTVMLFLFLIVVGLLFINLKQCFHSTNSAIAIIMIGLFVQGALYKLNTKIPPIMPLNHYLVAIPHSPIIHPFAQFGYWAINISILSTIFYWQLNTATEVINYDTY